MPRSFETYLDYIGCRSAGSKNTFRSAHKSFADIEELVASRPGTEEACDAIQAWIGGSDLHPATLRAYFYSLRGYLHYRGIGLDNMDIKVSLKFPAVPEEERHPLSRQELALILEGCDRRRQVLYLAMSSSGMRIGEALRLRKEHFDLRGERVAARIPPTMAKTHRGRTTFLSSEAADLLLPRMESVRNSDPVFAASSDPVQATLTEAMYLGRLVKRLGLGERYESSRNRKITTHSFRAYFITRASRHDPNLAAMLAGHSVHMLQYDRPTEEEKLKWYLEIEPDLLVSEGVRLKRKIGEIEARHVEEIMEMKELHKLDIEAQRMRLEMCGHVDRLNDLLSDKVLELQDRIKEMEKAAR